MNVIVVGGGVAGLSTALQAVARGDAVTLLVKGALGDGATAWAQGGIAGAYGSGDSPALHAEDTLRAGDGHGDPRAVEALVGGAAAAIAGLVAAGVGFDRAPTGELSRGLEAAHSRARIAHAGGDATGAAISAALCARVRESAVLVREGCMAADLLVEQGRVRGIRLLGGETLRADAVVLATGGAGQLYAQTTNPSSTTGDGIALALRAGAQAADLEFVQFHPTVLAGAAPFLISEAVRGAGAVLRDADGRRFLLDEHPDAELAPRDVVARAVARQAQRQGAPVLLDATGVRGSLAERFPTIDAALRRRGIDWRHERVPVTPAAHYLMGGVVTDVDGRTSLPGLWAVGETACTGVHGANRLASNSLLEGAVFAARVAASLPFPSPPLPSAPFPRPSLRYDFVPPASRPSDRNSYRSEGRVGMQRLMWEQVGLLRTEDGLRDAVAQLHTWTSPATDTAAGLEDANLLAVARAVASAALARTESLGAHHRLSPALIGAA
ncbi:L-aspartate oxidase [Microbacterium sp. USHLN186]|uniref:L-aspartate oxidase n=1 Tax=Microbacterium sp. USHLN186 TaxID=3081286 RepID=UPI0030171C91